MTVLAASAVLAMAQACVLAPLAPVMAGLALHESGGDTAIINHNRNGTFDVGLAQINTSNFGWLNLTMATALDPCRNLAAGARVLLVRYNGNPPPEVAAAYSSDVIHRIAALPEPHPPPVPVGLEDALHDHTEPEVP